MPNKFFIWAQSNADSTLSEEVEKLRKLQQEGNFGGYNNGISKEPHTPSGSQLVPGEVPKGPSGGSTRKRSRDATPVTDELGVLNAGAQADPTQRQSTSELSEKAASSKVGNMQLVYLINDYIFVQILLVFFPLIFSMQCDRVAAEAKVGIDRCKYSIMLA